LQEIADGRSGRRRAVGYRSKEEQQEIPIVYVVGNTSRKKQ
jgi:hypothetical protein